LLNWKESSVFNWLRSTAHTPYTSSWFFSRTLNTCAALLAAVKSFKYSRAASGSAAAEGSAMDALRAEKSSGPCLAVMAPLGGNGGRREGQVDA
jgi:hypothetical protein